MPRIRCRYDDCIFLEEGFCGAAAVEVEPETGCVTYSRVEDAEDKAEELWEAEDAEAELEDDDEEPSEDDDDIWDEDDDEDEDY